MSMYQEPKLPEYIKVHVDIHVVASICINLNRYEHA